MISGGGVTKTIKVNQLKQLTECAIEVFYYGNGTNISFDARTVGDIPVATELQVSFTIEQTGPTGTWERFSDVTLTIPVEDYASPSESIPFNQYTWRIKDNAATLSVEKDKEYFYTFNQFLAEPIQNPDGEYNIQQIACPQGGSETNVTAQFNRQTGSGVRSTLAFDALNLPIGTVNAPRYSGVVSELYIQYTDTNGQNMRTIGMYAEGNFFSSVSGTISKLGNFNNGIIRSGFTAQFQMNGAGSLYTFTIQFEGRAVGLFPDPVGLNS